MSKKDAGDGSNYSEDADQKTSEAANKVEEPKAISKQESEPVE